VLLNVLKELHSTLEFPAIDSLSSLAGILERDSEVGSAGACRLGRVDFGRSVSNLKGKKVSKCWSVYERELVFVSDLLLRVKLHDLAHRTGMPKRWNELTILSTSLGDGSLLWFCRSCRRVENAFEI
jgi:hypothetical protein